MPVGAKFSASGEISWRYIADFAQLALSTLLASDFQVKPKVFMPI